MIPLPENTNIYFSQNAFSHFVKWLEINSPTKVFILCDENTHQYCLPYFLQNLAALPDYEVLELTPGEDAKSAEVLLQLWQVLSEFEADRHSLVINLGGGVVTDLGGFLAATYMRGISFVNFPTSLLAMADAASGAKTGINLDGYKNRVGAFAEAQMTGIVTEFLETLPQPEILSGLAEMFKHGLIASRQHFEDLNQLNESDIFVFPDLLEKTIAIKKAITSRDPKEAGERKILNFGHTIGHALESLSQEWPEPLSHGYAVALGMLVEINLSVQFTGLADNEAQFAREALERFYALPVVKFKAKAVLKLARGDKKNTSGELRFSLLTKIGEAVYDVPVQESEVVESLLKTGICE